MRLRRAQLLLVSLLLIGAMLGGVASASGEPRVAPGSIAGKATDFSGACIPFDNTHVLWVDAWDSSMNRYSNPSTSIVVDGSGVYSIPDLDSGDYKVRFRVYDAASNVIAYWWHGGGTTYESGTTVSVSLGTVTSVNPCLVRHVGGTFKGNVTSSLPGFDATCVSIMAYEATSGIIVGPLPQANAAGSYRYTNIPAGQYKALAIVYSGSRTPPLTTCPDPQESLDQWWKGGSGDDLYAASKPDLHSTGGAFTITGGALTKAIHFDLMPVGTCDGKVPTILGTTGDDVIVGTAGADVIMLYEGDDEAHGGNGKDTICGGKGQDNLFGDEKNDRIFGDRHNDYLTGGDGYDLIMGGNGVDQMFGGLGNDKMKGGRGDDLIHGNEDDDTLIGNKGDDTMYGHSGNDTLWGGPGTDFGDGGAGTDACDVFVETRVSC